MLPGAILGAVVLVGTLQALPLFVSLTSEVVALQALGTTFLLLVWLYVMANVIVFGAALNYVLAYGVHRPRGASPSGPSPTVPTPRRRRSRRLDGPELPRERGGRPRAVRVARASTRRRARRPCALSPRGTKTGSKPNPSAPDAAAGDRPLERALGDDLLARPGATATITQT